MAGPFVSFAQNAEDVVLARGLRPDERRGFWIDVGANHPVSDSVTAAFSQRGWRGVNVEPLPDMYAELVAQRPDDVNLNVALSDRVGRATLFAGPGAFRGNATLVQGETDHWEAGGGPRSEIEVEVTTLAAVVAEHVHGPVDFLKVDVEGAEREVLAGADWTVLRPRVVLVEATAPNRTEQTHEAWEPIMLEAGYRCVLFDGLNRFYVRDDEPELAAALSVPANPLDDYVDRRLVAALDDATALQAGLAATRAELDGVRAERDAMAATRTWRWSAEARRLYGRLRHRLGGAGGGV